MPLHRVLPVVLAAVLVGACASPVPKPLRESLPEAPTPKTAQAEPTRFLSHEVRWGGEILAIDNREATTEVELYARPLADDGEPRASGGEGVRFIARVGRFLDPAEYAPGKRLTVRGRLVPAVTRPVGEYPYLYPVVEAELSYLWPRYQPPPDPPWARDPYYDPWWPWGPWGPWRPYRYPPYWW